MMEIITRKEASARGLKRYFTGRPCKHGHVTERLSSNGRCFQCANLAAQTRWARDLEKSRKEKREYRMINREKIIEQTRNRYVLNAEKIRERSHKYRAANIEKVRQRDRARRDANPEKVREQHRKYRMENPERYREYYRKYRGQTEAPTRPKSKLCEICNCPPTKQGIVEDHCHVTGLFRGWLCSQCNVGTGLLKDSIERLQNAIAYLKRFEAEKVLSEVHRKAA
jgi:hypothetical protein